MKRLIKFRVWDNNKMHGVGLCDCCHTEEDVAHIWSAHGVDDHCDANDKAIPLQFTGIIDRNGKEIFEGHIIELSENDRKLFDACTSDGSRVRKHCLVGYKEGCAMFGRHAQGDPDEMNSYLWLVKDKCEVVGNFYENEELLKRKEWE